MYFTVYRYWNKFFKFEKLVRNICTKLRTCEHWSLTTREKVMLEKLPNSLETEDMKKIR